MEYYPKTLNDALYKHKATFHITTVQILGRQLISAVLMLRNNSIVHLDIKPSHILLNHANNNLKLCGFDKSSFHDCIIYSPTMMMPKYRAPEIILGYQISYGVDVWASALMLYEMATKRTLFPGNKNNDILYKQMCTFGNIPRDMIEQSAFKDKHFKQGIFVKDPLYPNKMSNTITTFIKNGRLERSIFEAYNYNWGKSADMQKVQKDIALLTAFHKLLEKMLELHPLNRIPIEFVYANPFIYETYDF
ncbi:serine/threonine-protein kinase PRP4 homolog [Aphomia sociella]